MRHCIYRAIFPNEKCYVGKSVNFYNRKRSHKSHAFNQNCAEYESKFCRAIRKYGWENIKWEILEKDILVESLCTKECEWIQTYNSQKNGYNETIGGEGYACGENHPYFGKERSIEIKEKIRQAHLGKKHTQEAKAKISKYRKDRPTSEETKKKQSESMKRYWQNVKKN